MRRLQPLHPATFFALLTLLLVLISWMAEAYGLQTLDPSTHEPVLVQSVLNAEGIRWLLRHAVSNLYDYSSLGQVLLGLCSLGLAYHSGLVNALTGTAWLHRLGQRGMVALVIGLGAASHLLGDVGYLLLMPLSASLFGCVGLSPVAGLLTSLLATGCTAIHYTLFLSVSGLMLLPLLYILCLRWLLHPAAKVHCPERVTVGGNQPAATSLTRRERRALNTALTAGALYTVLLLWCTYAMSDLFLGVDGSLNRSPLMEGMIPVACIGLAWMSGVYGLVSGRYRSDTQLMHGMGSFLPLLCDYFIILCFCAQFTALFTYSNLGAYLAIEGMQWFCSIQLPTPLLLLLFILLTAMLNLLTVPTELKWQLLSSSLLPFFNELHIPTETTLSAFCIGDSTTNLLSPFMLYLPLVLALLRRYQPQATYTTLLAHCWPVCITLLMAWMALHLLWSALGWPFAL